MKAVLQRVRKAQVMVADETICRIGQGLVVPVCAELGDTPAQANKLLAER